MKLNEGFQLLATAPDGVARLRELIVSLAVQGKLVSQDPSDEPATTLLQRVRHEKDSLIADGQVKRDKPIQRIDHVDAPFAVPAAWVWTRFGAVVMDSEAGWSPSCENVPRTTGQWGVLKVSAVSWGKFRPQENKGLPGDLVPRPEYEVRRGDFLVSRANTEELVARSVIVETDEPALMMSDKIIRLRLSKLCEPQYLNLFNNGEDARRHYIKHASGTSSSMKNVSRDVILNLPIPLPPAAEQIRVVAKVNELMRICDELEEQGRLEAEQHARLRTTLFDALAGSESPHALAENWSRVAAHFDLLLDRPEAADALEQTVLQLAVRGLLVSHDSNEEPASELVEKIRAEKDRLIADGKVKRDKPLPVIAEDEQPFALPPSWEWMRWNEVAKQIGDIDHKMPNEVPDGIPYVSPKDFLPNNGIDFENAKKIAFADFNELSSKIKPERGDLIYPRYGTIGKVRLVQTDRAFLASYSCAIVKVLHTCVLPEFQYYVSISQLIRDQARSATNKTTQPNVGLKSIQAYAFPLPPLAEQKRIVSRVNELLRLCADLREGLTARRTYQSRFAEALVEQAVSAGSQDYEGGLAVAA